MRNEGYNHKEGKVWELDSVGSKKVRSVHNAKRALSKLSFRYVKTLIDGMLVIYVIQQHEMNGGIYDGIRMLYTEERYHQLAGKIEDKFEFRPTRKAIDRAIIEIAKEEDDG